MAHFKTQHVAYRKTGLEWEILGDLGQRLHHKEEAKEAYQRCLDSLRYSIKPWLKLMEMYADEGDLQRTLQNGFFLGTSRSVMDGSFYLLVLEGGRGVEDSLVGDEDLKGSSLENLEDKRSLLLVVGVGMTAAVGSGIAGATRCSGAAAGRF